MIGTKKQIMQHFIDAGMPEIYAFMAVEEAYVSFIDEYASETLLGAFIWSNSKIGGDFWDAIYTELEAIENFNQLNHGKF